MVRHLLDRLGDIDSRRRRCDPGQETAAADRNRQSSGRRYIPGEVDDKIQGHFTIYYRQGFFD